jgi:mono/diheme cytochrome c family protein
MSKRSIILTCITISVLTATALLSSGSAQEGFSAAPTPVPMDTPIPAEAHIPTEIPGPKDYGVPVEYANVVNPVSADGASLQRGEENYKANCIKCHGEEGRGDGPMAARQNPLPSDYRADHVMELSDGELFYIVTHGMRTWGFFDEETRWDLVNYVRTFQE